MHNVAHRNCCTSVRVRLSVLPCIVLSVRTSSSRRCVPMSVKRQSVSLWGDLWLYCWYVTPLPLSQRKASLRFCSTDISVFNWLNSDAFCSLTSSILISLLWHLSPLLSPPSFIFPYSLSLGKMLSCSSGLKWLSCTSLPPGHQYHVADFNVGILYISDQHLYVTNYHLQVMSSKIMLCNKSAY